MAHPANLGTDSHPLRELTNLSSETECNKKHHLCQTNKLYFHSCKLLKRNTTTGFLLCLMTWDNNTEPKTPNFPQDILTVLVLETLLELFVCTLQWFTLSNAKVSIWLSDYMNMQLRILTSLLSRKTEIHFLELTNVEIHIQKGFQIHYSNKFIVSLVKKKEAKSVTLEKNVV